jgi:hypothetical protein
MKAAFLIASLYFTSFAIAQDDWTYMNRDEKINRYHLSAKGKLHLDGKEIEAFSLQETANRIGISRPSPDGKYVVVLSFGDEGDSQTTLLNVESRTPTNLSLQGTPMVWQSWSPDSSHLLLLTYADSNSSLYSVPMNSFQARKVPIEIHKEGEMTELDTTTVTWTAPDTFEIEATIHCDPVRPDCDSRTQEKVLRTYKLNVNAASLQVVPEEVTQPQIGIQ